MDEHPLPSPNYQGDGRMGNVTRPSSASITALSRDELRGDSFRLPPPPGPPSPPAGSLPLPAKGRRMLVAAL